MVVSSPDKISGRDVYVNVPVPQVSVVVDAEERSLPVCPLGWRRRCVALASAGFIIGVVILSGYLVGAGRQH